MPLFKNKDHSNKKAKTAATFSSVIVVDGYTLRPVKKASTVFRNRTFFVSLSTNKFCSFSEMYDAARFLSNTWRSIINKDCKYQQSLNNLPSFVGVRNICFRPLNNAMFEPYMVVELDNIQAAAFIARCWCRRTGQMPRTFSLCLSNKNGDPFVVEEDLHKSSPLYIEVLWRRYQSNIVQLQFGAAVSIAVENKEFETHVFPVQGVRCSQSFGVEKNIHTVRKLKQLYENKANGTLERLRKTSRSAASLEYERAKKSLIYSHISRSEYGAKEIFGVGNRYQRARDKYAYSVPNLYDTQLQSLCDDGVLLRCALRTDKLTERDKENAATLGVVIDDGVITEEVARKNVEASRIVSKVDKEARISNLNAQQKRRLKEAAISTASNSTNHWSGAKVKPVDVEVVMSALKEIANISVEADGQINIKF